MSGRGCGSRGRAACQRAGAVGHDDLEPTDAGCGAHNINGPLRRQSAPHHNHHSSSASPDNDRPTPAEFDHDEPACDDHDDGPLSGAGHPPRRGLPHPLTSRRAFVARFAFACVAAAAVGFTATLAIVGEGAVRAWRTIKERQ